VDNGSASMLKKQMWTNLTHYTGMCLNKLTKTTKNLKNNKKTSIRIGVHWPRSEKKTS
jgi:hypothetical protein